MVSGEGLGKGQELIKSALIGLRLAWETSTAQIPSTIESRDMRDTFAISIISILSDM
jgi:hypothetical protein